MCQILVFKRTKIGVLGDVCKDLLIILFFLGSFAPKTGPGTVAPKKSLHLRHFYLRPIPMVLISYGLFLNIKCQLDTPILHRSRLSDVLIVVGSCLPHYIRYT